MVLLLPAIFKKLIFITQRVSSLKNWLRKLIKKLMKLKKIKNGSNSKPKFRYYRSTGGNDYFDKYTDLREFRRRSKRITKGHEK